MKAAAALTLTLAGCASMHGPLDVITPDELTIGRGTTSSALTGGHMDYPAKVGYDGESESNYAALTWNIPSFQDPVLSREERRAIRDENYAAAMALDEEESVMEAVREAPPWLPWAMGGSLALLLLVAGLYSRRQPEW